MKKSVELSRVWNNPRRENFSLILFAFLSEDEFLDTDRLRQLDYGNLVLRRQMHHYLGSGVLFSIALLLLFWFVTFHWDDVASAGRRSSGKALGDSYELVTAMVQLAPPPPLLSASVAASPVTRSAVSSIPGKVAMVSEDQATLAHPYAAQSEIKQDLQNQEAQGALAGVDAGSGSGRGSSESSGIEGLGDDGAIFGACEKMPAFLEQKKPVYPETARLAGITGKVLVKVLIGADGHPVKAVVVKRFPEECTAFDRVALQSVLESTYSPAIQNGQPVKVWCIIPVSFSLTEGLHVTMVSNVQESKSRTLCSPSPNAVNAIAGKRLVSFSGQKSTSERVLLLPVGKGVTMKCARLNISARKRSGQLINYLQPLAIRLNWPEISA